MGKTILVCLVCALWSCGDHRLPETLDRTCQVDDSICKAPFTCIHVPSKDRSVCTKTCDDEKDCPVWDQCNGEEGHGPCREGVCSVTYCE